MSFLQIILQTLYGISLLKVFLPENK